MLSWVMMLQYLWRLSWTHMSYTCIECMLLILKNKVVVAMWVQSVEFPQSLYQFECPPSLVRNLFNQEDYGGYQCGAVLSSWPVADGNEVPIQSCDPEIKVHCKCSVVESTEWTVSLHQTDLTAATQANMLRRHWKRLWIIRSFTTKKAASFASDDQLLSVVAQIKLYFVHT